MIYRKNTNSQSWFGAMCHKSLVVVRHMSHMGIQLPCESGACIRPLMLRAGCQQNVLRPFLFPSPQDNTKAFSDTVIDQKVRQCRQDLEFDQHWVIHGLRSSFKTWAAEEHSAPAEVIEACLAHSIPGVEGRYFRGDFFAKRKQLMNDWNQYCFGIAK